MAQTTLIEEFHLAVRAPRGLAEAEYEAIKATLDGKPFQSHLRRAARRVVRHHPSLARVRVRLSR